MLVPVEDATGTFKMIGHPFDRGLIGDLRALEDYVPQPPLDVRFAFCEHYNAHNHRAFEAEWRDRGLSELFEVKDVVRWTSGPFFTPEFIVARFDQPKNALFFLLWMS